MKKCGALSGCTITRYGFAIAHRGQQEVQQCQLGQLNLSGKSLVALNRTKSEFLFLLEQRPNTGLLAVGGVFNTRRIDPKGPPMCGELLHIKHAQPMSLENPDRGNQREVRKMLVINGVELIAFDQSKQVRKFQSEDSLRLQQELQAFHEIV